MKGNPRARRVEAEPAGVLRTPSLPLSAVRGQGRPGGGHPGKRWIQKDGATRAGRGARLTCSCGRSRAGSPRSAGPPAAPGQPSRPRTRRCPRCHLRSGSVSVHVRACPDLLWRGPGEPSTVAASAGRGPHFSLHPAFLSHPLSFSSAWAFITQPSPQGNPETPQRGFTEQVHCMSPLSLSPRGSKSRCFPWGPWGLRERTAGEECFSTAFCPRRPM